MTAIAVGIAQGVVYEFVGPRGARAVVNDPTDPDFVGYLNEPPSGLERAGVRLSGEDVPLADGRRPGPGFYEGLAFTFKGLLQPDNFASRSHQDKLLEATDAMDADASVFWTPPGVDAVPVVVAYRQQQPTRITDRRPKTFLISGLAGRHAVVAQNESLVDVLAGALVEGGFTSPLVSPLASNPSASGEGSLEALGRSKAWPILEVYGPCSNPVLTNITEGKSLYLTYTLAADETLVIDTDPRRRTVKLNDQADRWNALDHRRSKWWPVRRGNNDIRVSFNTFSAGAKLRVRWRDAWG